MLAFDAVVKKKANPKARIPSAIVLLLILISTPQSSSSLQVSDFIANLGVQSLNTNETLPVDWI